MILAIDLGGTKLRYAVFDSAYQRETPIDAFKMPTHKDFIGQLKEVVLECIQRFPSLSAVSIGVPGPTRDSVMQGSRPLNCLEDVDFSQALADFDLPLLIRNDLYMAAYSELFQGVGQERKNFCLISFSTGIGVAVVANGVILDRRIEMGHQILIPDYVPPQHCTNHLNCWAALASGDGIENRFGTEKHSTAADIFARVLTDADVDELKKINAHAIGNILNAYDPEVIVIMGSLGISQFDLLIPTINQIEQYAINRPVPPIIKSNLKDNIGLIGAYLAAQTAFGPTSKDKGEQ